MRRTLGRGGDLPENELAEAERRMTDRDLTLSLLDAVHDNSRLSQRTLARELGIALGLTNTYLRRCVRKGLVKVSQIPPNRYAYYLTPKGFAEKSRRSAAFLARSFRYYRAARRQLDSVLERCVREGRREVVLCGGGDLAEIAIMCASQHPVRIVAVLDRRMRRDRLLHVPVVRHVEELGAAAFVLTDARQPQVTYDWLCQAVSENRVYAPRLLKVGPAGAEGRMRQ